MQISLEEHLAQFVKEHLDLRSPIVLGLSGGPDSMCLLHLLLDFRKKMPFELHIAHVDHGWRQESRQEARIITQMAETLEIPLHTTRLDPSTYDGSWEAEARIERIEFFTLVAKKTGASGVILAHHLDDQLETIFKRFLEGASLLYLSGIRPVTKIGHLTIFRPLLKVPKRDILLWVEGKKISYFEDPTNFDPDYLRGRMRTKIFPFLKEAFQKDFYDSVCRIGFDAMEMRHYFDEKTAPYFANEIHSDFGVFFDLSSNFPQSKIECREFFRKLGELHDFGLNRAQMDLAHLLLTEGKANKTIELVGDPEKRKLYFDRRRVFLYSQLPACPAPIKLQEGQCEWGGWRITVRKGKGVQKNNWQDFLQGSLETQIDEGEYLLSRQNPRFRRASCNKICAKLFNDKKVPNLFVMSCPAILKGDLVVEDFLSGSGQSHVKEKLNIKLEKISPS